MKFMRCAAVSAVLAASLVVPAAARTGAQVPPPPPPPMAPGPPPVAPSGHELVDRFITVFKSMGQPDFEEMDRRLADLADAARAAHEARTIDDTFFARFARVLLVAKLESVTDRGRILSSIVDREFSAFVRDVTGKTYDSSASATAQIGMLSDAMATELSRLSLDARRKSR
jgi:hypothetical protein